MWRHLFRHTASFVRYFRLINNIFVHIRYLYFFQCHFFSCPSLTFDKKLKTNVIIQINIEEKSNCFFLSIFQSDEPPLSFYAVYDGHAGKDAAAFAASHLHGRIVQSAFYPTDIVKAIQEAFNQTDETFLEKVS